MDVPRADSKSRTRVFICSYLPRSKGRGIERFAENLVGVLTAAGREVEIVDMESVSIGKGIGYRIRPLAAWMVGRAVNKKSSAQDIVVCNNIFSWNARRASSVAVYHMTELGRGIATRSQMGYARNLVVRTLNSWLDRMTGRGRLVVAVSGSVKHELETLYGMKVDQVIQHSVDLDLFKPSPDKAALRRELGLPENGFLVLYVGQEDPKKGFDFLVQNVLPGIRDSQKLVMVAETTIRPEGAIAVGRVALDKAHRYYQACDALVMPSYYEGFGLVTAEAMACGLPFVMSRTGIGVDLANDERLAGYIVSDMDASKYIACLKRLQSSKEEWISASRAARQYAEKHFAPMEFEKAYLNLMEKLSVEREGP